MSHAAAKKRTVLILDDHPSVAETLGLVLSSSGYDVHSADSVPEAIQSARTMSFDLLVTEVVLDGQSGIDAAIEIRKFLPHCKVLLMSGNTATGELLRRAQESGQLFDFLPKPIHPTVILEKLKLMSEGSN
jgi:CheY-like chemotaxis protein